MNKLEFWNEIQEIGTLNVEMELLVGIEPVLFVCVLEGNPKIKYLVMTYDSFNSTYVMRKIKNEELLLMLDKNVTMEETFRNGDEILKTYMQDGIIHVETYNSLEFDANMLPRKGATYNIRSQYILDYKKELRIPKFELTYKYDAYEFLAHEIFVETVAPYGNLRLPYQIVINEQKSDCEIIKRKIA